MLAVRSSPSDIPFVRRELFFELDPELLELEEQCMDQLVQHFMDATDLGQRKPHALLETWHHQVKIHTIVIEILMHNHDPHFDELCIGMTVNRVSMLDQLLVKRLLGRTPAGCRR